MEPELLADTIEVLDFCKLLSVNNFATVEQVNLKTADRVFPMFIFSLITKTLLRRPGGISRVVVQLNLRLLYLTASSTTNQKFTSASITRLQAFVSPEFVSRDAPSSRLYFIMLHSLEILKYLIRVVFTKIE